MSSLTNKILLILFFCHPPILFFLFRKYARGIKILLLAFLSFLFGWGLCFYMTLIGWLNNPLNNDTLKIILFLALMFGWIISGVILFLWSPAITFFLVKNKKIKLAMGLITCSFILFFIYIHYHDRYDWGVPGNHLLHKTALRAGFDSSYVKVFEAKNDLLKKKMIRKWNLQFVPAVKGRYQPESFAAIGDDKPYWWPTKETLEKLEGYSRVDVQQERYNSLWYDPNPQRLYLEHGNW